MSGQQAHSPLHDIEPRTHYLVYHAVLKLPDGVRNAIYVESYTWVPPNGWLFQVVGNPSTGPMAFFDRPYRNPLDSEVGKSLRRVGWVFYHDYEQKIRHVCQTIVLPGQQSNDGPPPPQDCEEWTENAIDALRAAGIVLPLRPCDPTDTIFRS